MVSVARYRLERGFNEAAASMPRKIEAALSPLPDGYHVLQ